MDLSSKLQNQDYFKKVLHVPGLIIMSLAVLKLKWNDFNTLILTRVLAKTNDAMKNQKTIFLDFQ